MAKNKLIDKFEYQILKELLNLDMDKFKVAPLGIATSAVIRARKKIDKENELNE